mmetsp:Transcript_36496/g.112917  ORF Transcript_36496/g.112917 Transcript_36496/m.112917 type:complete len:470 (-) Transcript_36496:28-1437(-)
MARGRRRLDDRVGRGHRGGPGLGRHVRGHLGDALVRRLHRRGPRHPRRPRRDGALQPGRHVPEGLRGHRGGRRPDGGRGGAQQGGHAVGPQGRLQQGVAHEHARRQDVAHRRGVVPLHRRGPDRDGQQGPAPLRVRRVRPLRRGPGAPRRVQLHRRAGRRQGARLPGARRHAPRERREEVDLRDVDGQGRRPGGLRHLGEAPVVVRVRARRARRVDPLARGRVPRRRRRGRPRPRGPGPRPRRRASVHGGVRDAPRPRQRAPEERGRAQEPGRRPPGQPQLHDGPPGGDADRGRRPRRDVHERLRHGARTHARRRPRPRRRRRREEERRQAGDGGRGRRRRARRARAPGLARVVLPHAEARLEPRPDQGLRPRRRPRRVRARDPEQARERQRHAARLRQQGVRRPPLVTRGSAGPPVLLFREMTARPCHRVAGPCSRRVFSPRSPLVVGVPVAGVSVVPSSRDFARAIS